MLEAEHHIFLTPTAKLLASLRQAGCSFDSWAKRNKNVPVAGMSKVRFSYKTQNGDSPAVYCNVFLFRSGAKQSDIGYHSPITAVWRDLLISEQSR